MNSQLEQRFEALLFSLRSLSVYRALLQNGVVESLCALLEAKRLTPFEAASLYGEALSRLSESGLSLCDYIYQQALYDDNVFTRRCARGGEPDERLLAAVRHDLRALSGLAYLLPGEVKEYLRQVFPALADEAEALPEYAVGHTHYLADEEDWANEIPALEDFCRDNGCGEEARLRQLVGDEDAARTLLDVLGSQLRKRQSSKA